jgi:hypothetical protein
MSEAFQCVLLLPQLSIAFSSVSLCCQHGAYTPRYIRNQSSFSQPYFIITSTGFPKLPYSLLVKFPILNIVRHWSDCRRILDFSCNWIYCTCLQLVTTLYRSHTQTTVLSHLLGNSFQWRTFFLPRSCPYSVATVSRQSHTLTAGFNRCYLQLLAPGLG